MNSSGRYRFFSLFYNRKNPLRIRGVKALCSLPPLQNPDSGVLKQHFLKLEEVHTVPLQMYLDAILSQYFG